MKKRSHAAWDAKLAPGDVNIAPIIQGLIHGEGNRAFVVRPRSVEL